MENTTKNYVKSVMESEKLEVESGSHLPSETTETGGNRTPRMESLPSQQTWKTHQLKQRTTIQLYKVELLGTMVKATAHKKTAVVLLVDFGWKNPRYPDSPGM